jgi:integrase
MGIFAKLKEFNKGKTLSFGEISVTLLNNFIKWCMNVKGNREVTAQKAVEVIRTCFNDAINEGIIKDNPVNKIKLKEFEGKRNALTSEAVKYLIQYLHTEKLRSLPKQRLSGFIFACCCGLRWSDIRKMKFKDLQGNKLDVIEVKTKKHRTVTIMQSALDLIDFSKKKNNNDYIFEMGNNSSPTNDLLKETANKINDREGREIVGKKLVIIKKGIETISNSISFHSSRATFATMAENHTDIFTAARLTGNTPKVAANSYVPKENKEKHNKTLLSIENDFFG